MWCVRIEHKVPPPQPSAVADAVPVPLRGPQPMTGSRPGSAATRPGSAASSRPGCAKGGRPGSGSASRPGSGSKKPAASGSQASAGKKSGSKRGSPTKGASPKQKHGAKELLVDDRTLQMMERLRVDFVSDADPSARLATKSMAEAGSELASTAVHGTSQIAATLETLDQTFEQGGASVQAWAEKMHAAVDSRAEALLAQLQSVKDTKISRLQKQSERLRKMAEELQKEADYASEIPGGDGTSDGLEKVFAKYGKKTLSLAPCETATLRLEGDVKQMVKSAGSFGGVAGLQARVKTVQPAVLPATGGELIITGSDFGKELKHVEVRVGGRAVSDLSIGLEHGTKNNCWAKCVVPPGHGVDLAVEVRVQNEDSWAAAGTTVSYEPPVVSDLFPPGGAVGSTLSIKGTHLGSADSVASGETRVFVGEVGCEECTVAHDHEELIVVIPDQCGTGTHPVVVARGGQRSQAEGQLPGPETLYEVTVGERFGLNPEMCGGGVDFGPADETSNLIYTARKIDNEAPDYTTIVGTTSFAAGLHTWEVNFDQIGNTRVGLARMPLGLDVPLHSKRMHGEAWFVDYEGMVKYNNYGKLTTLKNILPLNVEFQHGDSLGICLDLRDNTRYGVGENDSIGRGKLMLVYKGQRFLAASDLAGEFWPVFQMDNINEQLSVDFVTDGESEAHAAPRRALAIPEGNDSDLLFQRIDRDGSGLITLVEVTEACHNLFPELEQTPAVVVMAFRTADASANGKISKHEFHRLFQYLLFFNRLWHLFEQIDSSGDGILSLAEFKAGARLLEPTISEEEVESEYARMDAQDEGEGEVRFDYFCAWLARRNVEGITAEMGQRSMQTLQERLDS